MRTDIEKRVVSQHRSYRYTSSHGSVSIRKDKGLFHVYVDPYDERKAIHETFKTLRGAEVCFNYYRKDYL